MKYIVIELQKNGDQISNIVTAFNDANQADNKYFTILASAAISNVERHAASMLTDEGECLRYAHYDHPVSE